MRIFKNRQPYLILLLCLLLLPGFFLREQYTEGFLNASSSESSPKRYIILTPTTKIGDVLNSSKSSNIDLKKEENTAKAVRKEKSSQAESKKAVALIDNANRNLNRKDSYCYNCSLAPVSGQESILKKATSKTQVANRCSNIMSPTGSLGSIGNDLISIMSSDKYRRHFLKDDALGEFCPNFNELSPPEKLQAWTWFWTALAHVESSCTVDKKHPTTYKKNGRVRILNPRLGYGLWALEWDPNIRRSRGKACAHIMPSKGQAECTIDIMVKKQLSKNKTAGIYGKSYWGPVRRGEKQLIPHMKRLRLCFP